MDIRERLRKIFEKHCNLTMEEFNFIDQKLKELKELAEDREDLDAARKMQGELNVLFQFLYDTFQLTTAEHEGMRGLAAEIVETAEREAGEI